MENVSTFQGEKEESDKIAPQPEFLEILFCTLSQSTINFVEIYQFLISLEMFGDVVAKREKVKFKFLI